MALNLATLNSLIFNQSHDSAVLIFVLYWSCFIWWNVQKRWIGRQGPGQAFKKYNRPLDFLTEVWKNIKFIRLYKINDVFHELKANNTAKQFLLLLKICDIQSGGSQSRGDLCVDRSQLYYKMLWYLLWLPLNLYHFAFFKFIQNNALIKKFLFAEKSETLKSGNKYFLKLKYQYQIFHSTTA